MKSPTLCAVLGLALAGTLAASEPITLTVHANKPGAAISPTLFGVFFEDINFGADGGLYAELVKNRSFEFPDALLGWHKILREGASGAIEVRDQEPYHAANPHYVRLKVETAGAGFGLSSEGFRGMGAREGEAYDFSAQVRAVEGGALALRIELADEDGRTVASARLGGFTPHWQKHSATLRATATAAKARLNVLVEGRGSIDLDWVSLFPRQTWKKRANGLRADLVEMLRDLKPGFVRFPGGCIVEGRYLSTRYQWKTTIGPPEERRLIISRWNDEFQHRPTPDYYQSFGLGFYEFFLLCEDIGAEPLPILNCGMACQFNSGELVPLEQLEPYIQDALDLIEFANGPADSPWGRRRAELGHPGPFKMKYLGVGNEQWGPQYLERYERFAKVLGVRHPEIRLVSSAGPDPADDRFRSAWARLRALQADIVDEHCYARPDWFLNSADRYDRYDRKGPKVFMGEYAAQSVKTVSPENRSNWECALAEAAFMTGLERNADVVVMSSYAPLLAHIDAWQWRPNLIWFDNLRVFGTPSYYVQQLFSRNRGDVLLPVDGAEARPAPDKKGCLYASASLAQGSGEVILKVVNADTESRSAEIQLAGVREVVGAIKVVLLTAEQLTDENSLDHPDKVAPTMRTLDASGTGFRHEFPPNSLTVLRMAVR